MYFLKDTGFCGKMLRYALLRGFNNLKLVFGRVNF